MSVVSSSQVCGNLLWQPWVTNTISNYHPLIVGNFNLYVLHSPALHPSFPSYILPSLSLSLFPLPSQKSSLSPLLQVLAGKGTPRKFNIGSALSSLVEETDLHR